MEHIGIAESSSKFGITIIFDTVVEKTVPDWQITPVTLLTRLGGIIGVGKNLLWVIIFFSSSVTLAINFLKCHLE